MFAFDNIKSKINSYKINDKFHLDTNIKYLLHQLVKVIIKDQYRYDYKLLH